MLNKKPSWMDSIWFSRLVLVLTLALMALRFSHLNADPLNHSFWSDDNAKYTDEGWWSNAGQYSVNEGTIHPSHEWMPASAVPVWPLLTVALFHLTGISIVAARAMEVCFSLGALLFAVLVVRRLAGAQSARWIALLAAASGVSFFFGRMALLEQPLLFFGFLALWYVVVGNKDSWTTPAAAGVACALMVLTKTTGIFLIPAILYPAFFAHRTNLKPAFRIAGVVLVVMAAALLLENALFASHYATERASFFAASKPHLGLKVIVEKVARLFLRGTWADPVYWPLALAGTILSLTWMRGLWSKPLWGFAILWIAGYSAFIVYHVDGPPRYFSVLALPLIMMAVMLIEHLYQQHPRACSVVIALCAVSFLWNMNSILRTVLWPEYTTAKATSEIKEIIERTAGISKMVYGPTANTLGLNTGLRNFNAAMTKSDTQLKECFDRYNPGWYFVEKDGDTQRIERIFPPDRLKFVASWPWMDNPTRGQILLYQILPPPK